MFCFQKRNPWIAAAILPLLAVGRVAAYPAVGNPAAPANLQAAIIGAYQSGAAGVTVNPGRYQLPSGNITLRALTRRFEIIANRVTLVDPQNGIALENCADLTLVGLTIASGVPNGNQGRVTAFGSDPDNAGVYCEIQCDAGYYTTGWGYNTVMIGNSNQQRPGCTDLGWFLSREDLGNNKIRAHFAQPKNWDRWSLQIGDYLTSHGGPGGPSTPNIQVTRCQKCLFQGITILASCSWCAIREDNCTGNHYYNDTITYGPPPPGTSAVPLRSTGSGMQAINDYVGPDVQRCLFEGMSDDGFDLRGSLVTVKGVSGNTVTLAAGGAAQWNIRDAIRISDDKGGYQDAHVTGADGDTLTLDSTVTVHAETGCNTRASNPGRNCAGYKIIDTVVRDNRARGALVRGDNGLIQGCTFTNISMQAVLIGLEWEYAWGEGDYSHNVLVQNNTMTNVGWASNQAIYIGGSGYGNGIGSLGNKNVTIRNNTFNGVWGTNILASAVTGLSIIRNLFDDPYRSPLSHANGPVIGLELANDTNLSGNLVTGSGPYLTGLVKLGDRVTNVRNNNSLGIQKGEPSSGARKFLPGTNAPQTPNATGRNDGTLSRPSTSARSSG